IALPPELRNQLSRLVLADAAPSAGGVVLLDERWRRRPVGLVSEGALGVETPLLGKLFYLHRALDPYTEVREGDVASLLKRQISVIVLADHVVLDGPEHEALANWVQKGGLLLRFAGPQMAAHPDSLLPVTLLEGDRRLGGAMSWSKPAALAAFASDSPFAGLAVPPDVRVTRQVLAQPDAALAAATWARLTDGTPLVTQAVRGAGRVVLFHVTANADWSDLPLSGLFVDMLRRLVAVANGVSGGERGGQKLAPAQIMDGFGVLGPPPAVATGLTAAELANAAAGPRHPPGLYGPAADRRVLNLSANLPLPVAAPAVGTRVEPIDAASAEQPIGPFLLALALALLAADLLVSLRLRGLLLARAAALLVMALVTAAMVGAAMVAMAGSARAQDGPWPQGGPNPALQTRLAYVVTGDAQVDAVSRAGLQGLADFVNHRTAAVLAAPAGVVPGQDDLSFYPLLYWPITADAPTPSEAMVTALNAFTAHGGIILIDTRGGGSGAGFAPGAASALERLGQGLAVPPLAPLTSSHVLARSFYLLREFPGRYVGETVWVQRDQDRSNDSVSPVIIGANDWAAAWAVDGQGRNPYAAIPGGERQRLLAYRFGVNLVMYALTGNYKGDQVHVPAILERLGQ
ncbi:MAG: DUF4159 domain-containing protein, partial [Rhodospirillales bacterium]|nr:DUF4159 domain-containing protein [Rhodospirillales bacterium]